MPAPSLADIVGGDEEPTPAPMAESKFQEVLDLLDEIADEELKEDQEVLDEELVVDMAGQHKNGTFETNEATLAYQQEMELAKQESTKHKEENEELEKKLEELDEAYNKLSKENELYENTIYKLNQRVKSTLLSNAKLLYTNRALKDASLNERQKTKIAEAIQKARNPEEAKALWETLRTTVGSDSNVKKGPQSLSESVNRRPNLSSMLPRRNNTQSKQEDTFSDRMRKLAGIK
jgi:plasmid stabilization system protein ParE